jgi:hypothetical protein
MAAAKVLAVPCIDLSSWRTDVVADTAGSRFQV